MHPSLESLPVIALIKQYIFEIKKEFLLVKLHYGFIIVLLHARTQLQTAATPRFLNFYTHFCSFYHLDISSFHYPLIWQSVTLAHSICALPETLLGQSSMKTLWKLGLPELGFGAIA